VFKSLIPPLNLELNYLQLLVMDGEADNDLGKGFSCGIQQLIAGDEAQGTSKNLMKGIVAS
jgi:hypothetical protein